MTVDCVIVELVNWEPPTVESVTVEFCEEDELTVEFVTADWLITDCETLEFDTVALFKIDPETEPLAKEDPVTLLLATVALLMVPLTKLEPLTTLSPTEDPCTKTQSCIAALLIVIFAISQLMTRAPDKLISRKNESDTKDWDKRELLISLLVMFVLLTNENVTLLSVMLELPMIVEPVTFDGSIKAFSIKAFDKKVLMTVELTMTECKMMELTRKLLSNVVLVTREEAFTWLLLILERSSLTLLLKMRETKIVSNEKAPL